MGNQQSNPQNFNPKEWTMINTNPNQVTLWQNNHNHNIHIEEYRIYTIDQQEFGHQRQLYFQRKNHPYWVAAYYFQQEKTAEICVSRSIAHIFIEKIPIKIFDLRDLPIPDLIHAHNQCFEGFKSLAQSLGCFRVQSQFIGVNQKGIVKVWAGSQWSQIGIFGNKISQEEMVRSIIESLQICSYTADPTNHTISLKTYLYRNTDRLTFDQAIQQLRNFSYQFNQGVIPSRLQSLYNAHHFDMFLDPLLRSNHLQHSKHISHMSSTNLQENYLRNRQETTFRRVESGDISYAFGRKIQTKNQTNAKKPQAFLSCMNDQQKLNTSKLVTNEEVLKNYYKPPLEIQANQNIQYQQFNAPQILNSSISQKLYTPVPLQNAAPFIAHQHNPIREQNIFRNPFTEVAIQQKINQQRTLPIETNYHKTSQPNLSHIQIQYNNPTKTNVFQPQTWLVSQFANTTSQPQQTTQIVFNNQPNLINRSISNQSQPLPPVIPASNNVQFSTRPVQTQVQKRKRPIPQSIIMQLYTSQDKLVNTANDQYLPLKTFGLVKQSVSEVEESQTQLRFDSATIIKDGQHNNLTGVPHNYYLNTNTNLHSIQQLSSQHNKYDNISQTSSPSRQKSQLFQGWGQSAIKKYEKKMIGNSDQTYLIDPNDGKTPQNLLKSIRQLSNSRNVQNYPQYVY